MDKVGSRTCALFASAALLVHPLWSAPAAAQATPDTLVSVCSGVSLPPSAVTSIMDPVVTGIYDPIESNINQTLSALSGVLGLPGPLNVDLNGLLSTAASGSSIGLNVLAQDGSLVAPGDECNAQADSYTLDNPAGIAIGGNAITGLGANGQEAQAGEIDSVAIGNRAATDAAATQSIAIGTDATVGAGGSNSVALGSGSTATAANSVALGAGSVASRGPQAGYSAFGLPGTNNSAGEVSVGAPGQERQITNVAPGSAPTDAVNMAQLQAVAATVPADAVQYDDPSHSVVTLDGAGGTIVTNVAAGAVNATSTDAVNGSQLNATNLQVQSNTDAITNLEGDVSNLQTSVSALETDVSNIQTQVNNISNGAAGPVRYSDASSPTVPNGGVPSNDVTLVGGAEGPVGLHNVADGVVAAGSTDAVNGGQLHATNQSVAAAQTTADDALELANNSVQYDDASRTSVTFNNGGSPAVLRNVAAGVSGTDAVNVAQLNNALNTAISGLVDSAVTQANAYTDMRFSALEFDLDRLGKEARAGTAAGLAAAALPQPLEAGRTLIGGGVGFYRGQGAFVIGASHASDNGRSVFKVGITYDTSDKVGANAGFGVQF